MNLPRSLFVAFTMAVFLQRAVAAPALGPLGGSVETISKMPFSGLNIEAANSSGSLRWAAWGEGPAGSQTVRLALLDTAGTTTTALWATAWPDAYGAALRPTPEWQFAGHQLMAITMQFGAAAEQIDIYGLDEKNQPVRLAEKLGAAIGWAADSSGDLILIVYSMPDSALVPACFGWNPATSQLSPASCPG
jgi:hypothetical protein